MADYDVPITGIDELIIDAVCFQLQYFYGLPQRFWLGVNPFSPAEIQHERRQYNG